MISASDFYVFEKWLNAEASAFGRVGGASLVPPEDKEAYWWIYTELLESARSAQIAHPDASRLFLRPKQYSRERGSRGHRPVDLWVSICAEGAEVLGYMPQVYAIASVRGLEIGFAASIAEDDYFDPKSKERNRSIVPFINSKLPASNDRLTKLLDEALSKQGNWQFNRKTRLVPGDHGFDEFRSLAEMLTFLKSEGEETGAGTICRVYSPEQLVGLDLEEEFRLALGNFGPLLAQCAPTPWDMSIRLAQTEVGALGQSVDFTPVDEEDGRRKIWAEVARRQGQAAFRRELLEAYEGECAISRTNVTDVLQAAHIRPYNGPRTNHVTNGLLLRADLHNLFDLKLITINPNSLRVKVSPRLYDSEYWALEGCAIKRPTKPSQQPNTVALADHFRTALGDAD